MGEERGQFVPHSPFFWSEVQHGAPLDGLFVGEKTGRFLLGPKPEDKMDTPGRLLQMTLRKASSGLEVLLEVLESGESREQETQTQENKKNYLPVASEITLACSSIGYSNNFQAPVLRASTHGSDHLATNFAAYHHESLHALVHFANLDHPNTSLSQVQVHPEATSSETTSSTTRAIVRPLHAG